MAEKLSLVDMIGIGNLLEPLVAEDIITCEERDRIILRIAKDNEIDEYRLSVLAGYKGGGVGPNGTEKAVEASAQKAG